MLHVCIVSPKHIEGFRELVWLVVSQQQHAATTTTTSSATTASAPCTPQRYNLISVLVRPARAMGCELRPCLFRGPKRQARVMLSCLLDTTVFNPTIDGGLRFPTMAIQDLKNFIERTPNLVEMRQLILRRIPSQWKSATSSKKRLQKIVVWVYPDMQTNVEYGWEQRLIHWEHQLILAQSLAGYYSTLGGGYFMTRRVGTALHLAVQQQRMALFLGDMEMFYKCQINQAYDLIRCGKFGLAKTLIQNAKRAAIQMKDNVLFCMCDSAMLFRKRVRQSALQEEDNPQSGSPPVDDYYRIRIIKDQSAKTDLGRFTTSPNTLTTF